MLLAIHCSPFPALAAAEPGDPLSSVQHLDDQHAAPHQRGTRIKVYVYDLPEHLIIPGKAQLSSDAVAASGQAPRHSARMRRRVRVQHSTPAAPGRLHSLVRHAASRLCVGWAGAWMGTKGRARALRCLRTQAPGSGPSWRMPSSAASTTPGTEMKPTTSGSPATVQPCCQGLTWPAARARAPGIPHSRTSAGPVTRPAGQYPPGKVGEVFDHVRQSYPWWNRTRDAGQARHLIMLLSDDGPGTAAFNRPIELDNGIPIGARGAIIRGS